jgi:hypothetical protein
VDERSSEVDERSSELDKFSYNIISRCVGARHCRALRVYVTRAGNAVSKAC